MICTIEGCSTVAQARKMCMKHYKRVMKHGDPFWVRKVTDPATRFWPKVNKQAPPPPWKPELGSCWEWTAGATAQGYGGFHPTKYELVLAHRWSYEQSGGVLEPDAVLDHLCRNRRCVNPSHLEQVSNLENLRRGLGYRLANGMDDKCINGHEYTELNTYRNPKDQTDIRCRTCAVQRDRDRQLRKKAA
jgi:hypothetical protein